MITRPTVLIFGAGASAPFGFPLGTGLRQTILTNLRQNSEHVDWLVQAGYALDDIRRFREAFLYSGKESVDAFLEHRTDCIDVGKAAIAQALIPCELMESLFGDQDGNLYSYLFRRLNAPLDKFANNKLAIVTYNYDRSFEQYLFTALKNSFRLDDKQAAALTNAIPVVHLHGHLGSLPWQQEGGREYVGGYEPIEIRNASRTIKIIHEAVEADPEFQEARELMDRAELLVFLGFGYDETNVTRLKINFQRDQSPRQIYGSYLGFTVAEINAINAHLFQGRLVFGMETHDALTFMRESITLS